jgi:homocysteine S-methyltransferase
VVATSASYRASFEGFACRGLDRRDAAGLMRRSVDLAWAARDQMAGDGQAPWVAASAGRMARRWLTGLSTGALRAEHAGTGGVAPAAAGGAGLDVLALETVPDSDEAEALMTLVTGLGIPVWLSSSTAAGRTRAGPRRSRSACRKSWRWGLAAARQLTCSRVITIARR